MAINFDNVVMICNFIYSKFKPRTAGYWNETSDAVSKASHFRARQYKTAARRLERLGLFEWATYLMHAFHESCVPLMASVVEVEGSLLAVNLSLKTLNLGEESSGFHACSICADGTLDSSAISRRVSRTVVSKRESIGLACMCP